MMLNYTDYWDIIPNLKNYYGDSDNGYNEGEKESLPKEVSKVEPKEYCKPKGCCKPKES